MATTNPEWRFTKRDRGAKERNPPLEWFFNLDVMENAGEPLVREGIQNSLDAPAGDGPVRVRIHLSGDAGALTAAQMGPFAAGLGKHLAAPDSGLKAPPSTSERCPFLVFEDFGTTGLGGDPEQDQVSDEKGNAFYHFFRAEGSSSKGEGMLGRFGIGKFAFTLCSHARAILAMTCREDGRQLLAGVATLKCHSLAGIAYQPDGWFGRFADDSFQLPLEDEAGLSEFRTTFGLTRDAEPGLSIVVPYYSPEQVTAPDIVEAVLRHFFLPVVRGELIVEVSWPTGSQMVAAGSVPQALSWLKSCASGHDTRLTALDALDALIKLADVAVARPKPDRVLPAPSAGGSLKWKSGCLEPAVRNALARKLAEGKVLVIRFPLHVILKNAPPKSAYFDVFIQEDPAGGYAKPVFVRKGNVIAAVGTRLKGYRVIVTVPDGPLSDALGKAENIAHTEWRKKSAEFKAIYKYSSSHIDYVVNGAANLLREVHATDAEVDFNALSDLFPDFNALDEGLGKKPKQKKNVGQKSKKPSLPPPPPKPKRYSLVRAAGGFSIISGAPEAVLPKQMIVNAAYAVRRGNPLAKFNAADFDLAGNALQVMADGCEIEITGPNTLHVTKVEDGFSVAVTGFDENRDLFVNVRVAS